MEESRCSQTPTFGFQLLLAGYPLILGVFFIAGHSFGLTEANATILISGICGAILLFLSTGTNFFEWQGRRERYSDERSARIINGANPLLLVHAAWGRCAGGGVAAGFLVKGLVRGTWDLRYDVESGSESVSIVPGEGECANAAESAFLSSLFDSWEDEEAFTIEKPASNDEIGLLTFLKKRDRLTRAISEALMASAEQESSSLFDVEEEKIAKEISVFSPLFAKNYMLVCFALFAAIVLFQQGGRNALFTLAGSLFWTASGCLFASLCRPFFFMLPPMGEGNGLIPPRPFENHADVRSECLPLLVGGATLFVSSALSLFSALLLVHAYPFSSIFLSAFLMTIPSVMFLSSVETTPPPELSCADRLVFHARFLEMGRKFEPVRVAVRNLYGYSPWNPRRGILKRLSVSSALALGVAGKMSEIQAISDEWVEIYLKFAEFLSTLDAPERYRARLS